MSIGLTDSPSEVVRQLLVDLSLGTNPSADGSYPVYFSQEPDKPDDCITVYDTEGRGQGNTMVDGKVHQDRGIQIRVRGDDQATASNKAENIAQTIDESVYFRNVTVTDLVGTSTATYLVESLLRTSGPLYLGTDPDSNRHLFTINAVVTLRELS